MRQVGSKSSTREKILEAARQEFAQNGLAGARVDKIAADAGANKAMIYYHFHSKDALYQAVIEDHVSNIADFIEQNVVAETDAEAFFFNIAEFLSSLFEKRADFIPIMLREMAAGGGKVHQAIGRLMANKGIPGRAKSMIDYGKYQGRFRNVDSTQAMISFIGMNVFYLILAPAINSIWEVRDKTKFSKERPAAVADLFLNGLKANKTDEN